MKIYRRFFGYIANMISFSEVYVHEVMLADTIRNDTYFRAIEKYVNPGDIVIDVGTGTGLLALFAASRNPKKVYAIDHSDVIKKARLVAATNGITNVDFLRIDSRRFVSSEQVDIIIHEQMSYDLFSENMIENLLDLRNRILRPGGKILPSQFEVYIEPIKLRDDYRVPFLWEQDIHQVKFYALKKTLRSDVLKSHYLKFIDPYEVDYLLCDPENVFAFDLQTMTAQDLPKAVNYKKKVKEDGRLDGFCLYFVVRFDENIAFSTSPLSRRTHWKLPLFRVEAKKYRKGDSIALNIAIDPINSPNTWAWSYS